MNSLHFSDQQTLEEAAQALGKQAMSLKLVPSFVIHYFPDNWVFQVPDPQADPMTPEEAYLYFQKLLNQQPQQAI